MTGLQLMERLGITTVNLENIELNTTYNEEEEPQELQACLMVPRSHGKDQLVQMRLYSQSKREQ